MKIGYARVSTAAQDSSIQVGLLAKEGVDRDRVYVDHGISGRQTQRPGLDNAINAAREGDIFCVTKLDRITRSLLDISQAGSP